MTAAEPLLSPVVRRGLARLGIAPHEAPRGSGLGGRVTPADLPGVVGAGGAPTAVAEPPEAPRTPAGHMAPIGPILVRARRRMADLAASAQLTSVTELDVTAAAGLRTTGAAAPERRAEAALTVFASVVSAIHAAVRAEPRLAATADPDLSTLRIPDAIDIGLVTSDVQGGERRLVLRDAGDGGSTPGAVLALLGTSGVTEVGPFVPIAAPIVVHDRSTSDVTIETTLLERPAALSFCLGALGRQVRATAGADLDVRWTSMLSVTYDHRVIDGADAARLLATIRSSLSGSR